MFSEIQFSCVDLPSSIPLDQGLSSSPSVLQGSTKDGLKYVDDIDKTVDGHNIATSDESYAPRWLADGMLHIMKLSYRQANYSWNLAVSQLTATLDATAVHVVKAIERDFVKKPSHSQNAQKQAILLHWTEVYGHTPKCRISCMCSRWIRRMEDGAPSKATPPPPPKSIFTVPIFRQHQHHHAADDRVPEGENSHSPSRHVTLPGKDGHIASHPYDAEPWLMLHTPTGVIIALYATWQRGLALVHDCMHTAPGAERGAMDVASELWPLRPDSDACLPLVCSSPSGVLARHGRQEF
nr:hypothetical protein CFP56_64831 [Quercus suber]